MTANEPSEHDLLVLIARSLMAMQTVEQLVRQVLTYAIQNPGKPINKDRLPKAIADLQARSLGQLFHELERRTDLHPTFKGILETFLRDRNTLAHDLAAVGGGDLGTERGRTRMKAFLGGLAQTTEITGKVFASLILTHAREVGLQPTPLDDKVEAWLDSYAGIEGNTFFVKGSQTHFRRGKHGEILSDQDPGVWDEHD